MRDEVFIGQNIFRIKEWQQCRKGSLFPMENVLCLDDKGHPPHEWHFPEYFDSQNVFEPVNDKTRFQALIYGKSHQIITSLVCSASHNSLKGKYLYYKLLCVFRNFSSFSTLSADSATFFYFLILANACPWREWKQFYNGFRMVNYERWY